MKPEEILAEVKKSGLRGRGGAGFPTATKWEFVRNAKGDEKYVVCNGDEGDPGAYMNRAVLEGNPHSIVEGMAIAAYTIGNVRRGFALHTRRISAGHQNAGPRDKKSEQYGLLGE